MSDLELFDNSTIDQLKWPDNEQGSFAMNFILPFIKNTPKHFIDNVDTTMLALQIDDKVLPVTLNESEYQNSYVCSPYGHYVNYALDQLSQIENRLVRGVCRQLVKTVGSILRKGRVNKVVMVNNWLYSTNLYPPLNSDQIQRIKQFLIQKFPGHAIIFRSVDQFQTHELTSSLQAAGFKLIGSRMVFSTDTSSQKPFQSRMFKRDFSALKNSRYEILSAENISTQDAARIACLYRALNIEKHSEVNPQFNANFIELALKSGFLKFKALKQENRIDGVFAHFSCGKVMTSPLFGYDTALPQELSLYPNISALLLLEAKESGMLLHQSSGGGSFKKLRRADTHIEYSAVYSHHLPFHRRLLWNSLKFSVNTFGIPIMKKIS